MKGFATTKPITMKELVANRGWLDSLQTSVLPFIPTLALMLRLVPVDKLKPYKKGLVEIARFAMMLCPEEFEVRDRNRK